MADFDVVVVDYQRKAPLISKHSFPQVREILHICNFFKDGKTTVHDDGAWGKRIYPGENVGWQKGCNIGLALSTAPYVVLCNDDIVVKTENWLELFKEAFEANPKLGLLGPTTDNRWPQGRLFTNEYNWREPVEQPGGGELWRAEPLDCMHVPLSFFCVALRREVIETVGYLDERFRYGYGADDNDYQMRAHEAGWQIGVHTGVYVEHEGGASYGDTRNELQKINTKLLKEKYQ